MLIFSFLANIVQNSFFHYENSLGSESKSDSNFPQSQIPVLCLSLLRHLLSRFQQSQTWLEIFHRKILLQTLLCQLHHNLRRQNDTEIIHAILGLLILVARTAKGSDGLLTSDLAQMIWLPLSDVKQATPEWIPVFQLSLQLMVQLLRNGKHEAVNNCVTVVTLLEEQLTSFLLAPKFSLKSSHIELSVVTASFIAGFMAYHKQVSL